MDGAVNPRKQAILAKLQARTGADGKPLPNYADNVAALKLELGRIEQFELEIKRREQEREVRRQAMEAASGEKA